MGQKWIIDFDYLTVFNDFDPLSLLVMETETMVPVVGHQNVPHIINSNSGWFVELPVSSTGGPKSLEGLQIVRIENVDFVKAEIRDVQLAHREVEVPTLGLATSVDNLLLQGDLLNEHFLLRVVTLQMCFLSFSVEHDEPEKLFSILCQTEGPGVPSGPNSRAQHPAVTEHLEAGVVLDYMRRCEGLFGVST